jgi:hypothetical protein
MSCLARDCCRRSKRRLLRFGYHSGQSFDIDACTWQVLSWCLRDGISLESHGPICMALGFGRRRWKDGSRETDRPHPARVLRLSGRGRGPPDGIGGMMCSIHESRARAKQAQTRHPYGPVPCQPRPTLDSRGQLSKLMPREGQFPSPVLALCRPCTVSSARRDDDSSAALQSDNRVKEGSRVEMLSSF